MELYEGKVAPCGIYCGGCPKYDTKLGCEGAEFGCRKCKGIYICCIENKKHSFCYECKFFPCYRFKQFAERWKKYGQNLTDNQLYIKRHGEQKFKEKYIKQTCHGSKNEKHT